MYTLKLVHWVAIAMFCVAARGCTLCFLFVCAYSTIVAHIASDHQQAESVIDDSLHQSDQLTTNSITRRLEDVYDRGSILGEGRFAVVWSGVHKTSWKEVALKMISRAKVFAREDIVENELRIMRSVNHPNIIKLIEDFETDDTITLVMELVQVCSVVYCSTSTYSLTTDLS